jgi:uncharacterized protein YndB with AHSA1/START domain
MRPALASVRLHAATRAAPERVWDALTAGGTAIRYAYGMHVESAWEVGATVMARPADLDHRWVLTGEVLGAQRLRRLSHTLGAPGGQPSLYVTWDLRRGRNATFICLCLDEPAPEAGAAEELEVAWFPVLARLVTHLDGSVALPTAPGES